MLPFPGLSDESKPLWTAQQFRDQSGRFRISLNAVLQYFALRGFALLSRNRIGASECVHPFNGLITPPLRGSRRSRAVP